MKLFSFFLLSICLSLSQVNVLAQGIGSSRSAIIEGNGRDFETGTTDTNLSYMSYIKTGGHMIRLAYFFDRSDKCVSVMSLWPIADANTLIRRFNEDYVKIAEGKVISYRDYQNSLIHEIKIEGEFVIITMKRDI